MTGRQPLPADADRFTERERALFANGTCLWNVEYGMVPGVVVFCEALAEDRTSRAVSPETLYCPWHADDERNGSL